MKKIYIQIKSDWVNTFIGTPDDVVDHLKDIYFDKTMLEDWCNNEEKLTITAVKMTEKEFDELGEWEP